MCSNASCANLLDASVLVKLYVNEDGSDIIQNYMNTQPTWYTTPMCFYEALAVLKAKWLYPPQKNRKKITRDEYLEASFKMAAYVSTSQEYIKDIDLLTPTAFLKVQSLIKKYDLDISDAFQILSVKEGAFSPLIGESRTVLVTADEKLADAAEKEGIRSWYIFRSPHP